jgi:hypothetical protein
VPAALLGMGFTLRPDATDVDGDESGRVDDVVALLG